MTATRMYGEVSEQSGYSVFINSPNRWPLFVDGRAVPVGTDWKAVSPFGEVSCRVIVDDAGKVIFDRVIVREVPTTIVVTWGYDAEGQVRIGIVTQPRPIADDPERPGEPNAPIIFGQLVSGIVEMSSQADHIETARENAIKEINEELGASVVLDVDRPRRPWLNSNATFVASWHDVYFIQVDLMKLQSHKSTRSEPIFKAEFITVPELLKRIHDGQDRSGASYRCGYTLGTLLLFFAHYSDNHPEFLFTQNANALP
jgi:hypothetical protein